MTLAGRQMAGSARLEEEPSTVADLYVRLMDQIGWEAAQRRLIRINAGRAPTHEELVDAVQRSGLSVAWIDVS